MDASKVCISYKLNRPRFWIAVKLMGRSSGFIAMHASLSGGQVDVCLIPEVI